VTATINCFGMSRTSIDTAMREEGVRNRCRTMKGSAGDGNRTRDLRIALEKGLYYHFTL
jgi:hypothetical protein